MTSFSPFSLPPSTAIRQRKSAFTKYLNKPSPHENNGCGGHKGRGRPAQKIDRQTVDSVAHDLFIVGDKHQPDQKRRSQKAIEDGRDKRRNLKLGRLRKREL